VPGLLALFVMRLPAAVSSASTRVTSHQSRITRHQPMSSTLRAHLQIHVCVVLWGFTAILGKLISLGSLPLVWWRMTFVVAVLLVIPRVWRAFAQLPWHRVLTYAGIGLLVAVHWLTFYGAIKIANASVAAVMMAFAPLFAAMIEPWLVGRSFESTELLIGLVAIPGVALIVGGTPADMHDGVLAGGFSALLLAIFGSLNKRYAVADDPLIVTAIELAAGVALVTLLTPWAQSMGIAAWQVPGTRDALLLAILAVCCTLLPFSLSLVALRHLSAFSAQLALCLEPVYAIVLAVVLLGEQRELTLAFYAGVAIVLGTVFMHPLLARRAVRRIAPP
jgi:drug/metabolite transporter (DMT)-like permease